MFPVRVSFGDLLFALSKTNPAVKGTEVLEVILKMGRVSRDLCGQNCEHCSGGARACRLLEVFRPAFSGAGLRPDSLLPQRAPTIRLIAPTHEMAIWSHDQAW